MWDTTSHLVYKNKQYVKNPNLHIVSSHIIHTVIICKLSTTCPFFCAAKRVHIIWYLNKSGRMCAIRSHLDQALTALAVVGYLIY